MMKTYNIPFRIQFRIVPVKMSHVRTNSTYASPLFQILSASTSSLTLTAVTKAKMFPITDNAIFKCSLSFLAEIEDVPRPLPAPVCAQIRAVGNSGDCVLSAIGLFNILTIIDSSCVSDAPDNSDDEACKSIEFQNEIVSLAWENSGTCLFVGDSSCSVSLVSREGAVIFTHQIDSSGIFLISCFLIAS